MIVEFIINHPFLVGALIILLVLLIAGEVKRALLGFKDIKPAEVIRLINHQDAVVLDVRDDREFENGHIVNAVHVPFALLDGRLDHLDKYKGRPFVVVCKTGQQSARAGVMLKNRGFEPVFKLGGGMLAWKNADAPVTTA
ncbi:MAG: rhodanese [Gammaproteobacteria bacterium]|nr:MAG: rhodanese [Gammaproteobacteria bacterium]TND05525.1 MAG: rhodanese [Gammaproteobacteria bacterium]